MSWASTTLGVVIRGRPRVRAIGHPRTSSSHSWKSTMRIVGNQSCVFGRPISGWWQSTCRVLGSHVSCCGRPILRGFGRSHVVRGWVWKPDCGGKVLRFLGIHDGLWSPNSGIVGKPPAFSGPPRLGWRRTFRESWAAIMLPHDFVGCHA